MQIQLKQPSTKGPADLFSGAAPDHVMTHLAIWEGPAPGTDEPETTWGEHVTDDEYRAALEGASIGEVLSCRLACVALVHGDTPGGMFIRDGRAEVGAECASRVAALPNRGGRRSGLAAERCVIMCGRSRDYRPSCKTILAAGQVA